MKYFWTPKPIGLKADILRHRNQQLELETKISELEANFARTRSDNVALQMYRNSLCLLMQSKAEVTSRIGK